MLGLINRSTPWTRGASVFCYGRSGCAARDEKRCRHTWCRSFTSLRFAVVIRIRAVRPIAEKSREGCDDAKNQSLHEHRRPNDMVRVEVGGREDRELKESWNAFAIGLPRTGKGVDRLEEGLHAPRRGELDAHMDFGGASVPPAMERARRDDERLAGFHGPLDTRNARPERAPQHLEALRGLWVHMLRRSLGSRARKQIELEQFASRLCGRAPEDDSVADHRILDHCPGTRHHHTALEWDGRV